MCLFPPCIYGKIKPVLEVGIFLLRSRQQNNDVEPFRALEAPTVLSFRRD